MRWRRLKFALFAVFFAAGSALSSAPTARAVGTKTSQTLLLWDDCPETCDPPAAGSAPKFYVRVSGDPTTRPTGSVQVTIDEAQPETHALSLDDTDADEDPPKLAKRTASFQRDLGQRPHRIETNYPGDDNFAPSKDVLHVPTATLGAKEDGLVTWTFTLTLVDSTPQTEKDQARADDKVVSFSVDGKAPANRQLDGKLQATYTETESPGEHTAVASYNGDLTFQPVQAVGTFTMPGPAPTAGATTTRPTPTTVRTVPRRTGTTAALSPINPSTSTSVVDSSTTSSTFGDFPTTPGTSEVAASDLDKDKSDGPPLVVVVTTLLALGVLGGIGAFRRYRRSAIDWL